MPLQVTKVASSSAKSHFKCNTARIACGIAVSTETLRFKSSIAVSTAHTCQFKSERSLKFAALPFQMHFYQFKCSTLAERQPLNPLAPPAAQFAITSVQHRQFNCSRMADQQRRQRWLRRQQRLQQQQQQEQEQHLELQDQQQHQAEQHRQHQQQQHQAEQHRQQQQQQHQAEQHRQQQQRRQRISSEDKQPNHRSF
jgi:hypothetical protein